MKSSALTVIFGLAMIVLGVVSYVVTNTQSATALIPAFFGIVMLLVGLLAMKPAYETRMAYAAMALAIIGLLGTFSGLMQLPALLRGDELARPAAVAAQSIMGLSAVIFLLFCWKFRPAKQPGSSTA